MVNVTVASYHFYSLTLVRSWLRYAFGLENCLTEEEINVNCLANYLI